jgi:hypothetical protein
LLGIVFLAFELRQNNDLMEADARFNRLSISRDAWQSIADNGELTELMVRARNGEELTDVESRRNFADEMRFLVNMEWMFREMPPNSPERQYVKQNIVASLSDPFFHSVWDDRKSYFDSEFVDWVEEILAK